MSLISRIAKGPTVAIRKGLNFAVDTCFEKVRKTLAQTGIEWQQMIQSNSVELAGFSLNVPKMDSVFFHDDRFEILIDARGFKPEEVKCRIAPNKVDVVAEKREKFNNVSKNLSLARSYHLPRSVTPENGECCLSVEGLLLITAPWNK